MNVAIGCLIEGKGLLIEGKLIKGSRVELVRVNDIQYRKIIINSTYLEKEELNPNKSCLIVFSLH